MTRPALNIRAIRTRLGWTQRALAQHLDVDCVTVNRWENGHHTPLPYQYDRLVALGQTQHRPEATVRVFLTPKEIRLILASLRRPGRSEPERLLARRLAEMLRLSTVPLGS